MCFFSIVTRFLIIVFGILRPARYTQLALDDMELTSWGKYWIVYAFLVCLELVGDTFFAWMPLYVEVKLLIVLWLIISAPQASVWVFDTIINPLLNQHMPKVDNFLMHGKRNFLFDTLSYTTLFCKQTVNAFVPLVSKLWQKKSNNMHAEDSITELKTNEESVLMHPQMQPIVETLSSSYSSHYYDTHAEEDAYEVAYPSSSSQSHSELQGLQRKKQASKQSLPELAKKVANQMSNSPAALRTKRKHYVYDQQFKDTTLKSDPLDIEESLQAPHISVERSNRSARRELSRFQ